MVEYGKGVDPVVSNLERDPLERKEFKDEELLNLAIENGSSAVLSSEAIEKIDKIFEKLEQAIINGLNSEQPQGAIKALCCIRNYYSIRRVNKPEIFSLAVQVAERIGDKESAGNLLRYTGDVQVRNRQLELAEQSYERAVAIYRETGQQRWIASCTRGLGDVKWLLGKIDEATKSFQKAKELFSSLEEPDLFAVANANRRLANVELVRGNLDEAEKLVREALSYYEEYVRKNDKSIFDHPDAQLTLARIENKRGNPDLTEINWTKALELFQKVGDILGESRALMFGASIHTGEVAEENKKRANELYQTLYPDEEALDVIR